MNNRLYENVPPPKIGTPAVIDNSHHVASENSDIEMKEEIKVVFPDGTVHTGGCKDGPEFAHVLYCELKHEEEVKGYVAYQLLKASTPISPCQFTRY